jgi:hypothetical protein
MRTQPDCRVIGFFAASRPRAHQNAFRRLALNGEIGVGQSAGIAGSVNQRQIRRR